MLLRFSLYGLLKNQRYFEPFLLLAMLDAGLGFAQIGLLVALRELTTTLLEIPSGAVADGLGRRRAMVLSFSGYVAAYVALGLSTGLASFAIGMTLVGVGDAFRTGTHKAMIFDWLAAQGRQSERVRIYGYTRSWSQIGAAIAMPIGALAVFFTGSYRATFWIAAVPAAANLVNLATYPRQVDGDVRDASLRGVGTLLWSSVRQAVTTKAMRGLLLEAAAFGGTYKVLKDYLQPVVATLALSLPLALAAGPQRKTAVAAGGVYVVLYLLSAAASRNAHRWVARFPDSHRAAWVLWLAALLVYGGLTPALALGIPVAATIGFVVLALLHNLFRPILVSRIDEIGDRKAGATILSIESQATSLAAIILAPTIGACVDLVAGTGTVTLWPAAAVATSVCALVVLVAVRRPPGTPRSPASEIAPDDDGATEARPAGSRHAHMRGGPASMGPRRGHRAC